MGFDLANIPDRMKRLFPPEVKAALGKGAITFNEALLIQEVKAEKDLQKLIRAALDFQEIPYVNSRMDKKTTTGLGTPDFLFVIRGMAFAWEVKMPGKDPEPHQLRMLAAYKRHGCITDVIRYFPQALDQIRTWMGTEYRKY